METQSRSTNRIKISRFATKLYDPYCVDEFNVSIIDDDRIDFVYELAKFYKKTKFYISPTSPMIWIYLLDQFRKRTDWSQTFPTKKIPSHPNDKYRTLYELDSLIRRHFPRIPPPNNHNAQNKVVPPYFANHDIYDASIPD